MEREGSQVGGRHKEDSLELIFPPRPGHGYVSYDPCPYGEVCYFDRVQVYVDPEVSSAGVRNGSRRKRKVNPGTMQTTGATRGPAHLVALYVATAGLQGNALGSDEEEITLLVYVLIDVLQNKVCLWNRTTKYEKKNLRERTSNRKIVLNDSPIRVTRFLSTVSVLDISR